MLSVAFESATAEGEDHDTEDKTFHTSVTKMDFVENYQWSIVPFTKSTASKFLEQFRSLYRWEDIPDNEERTALDIGFGDGTVTTQVIKPYLPASTRLDGADKSEEMIRFAKRCYKEQGHKFFLWDVEGEMMDESLLESYDHVFSFYCFHYIAKPRQALRNIYNILKPKGNVILVFMPNLPFHVAVKAVSSNPKWSSYMQDVHTMCPLSFANEESPHIVFADLMTECGFKNVITKTHKDGMLYDSFAELAGQMRFIDPFRERMPLELGEEYFSALLDALKNINGFCTKKYDENGKCVGVSELCDILIGYGEKCSQ